MNPVLTKIFNSRAGIVALLSALFIALSNSQVFALPQIVLYEAEAAALSGGAKATQQQVVGTRVCRYFTCYYYYDHPSSGGAYVNGLNAAGAKVTFSVEAAYTGIYKLPIAYTTAGQQASTLLLQVNDFASNHVMPQRTVSFPAVADDPNTPEKTPFVEHFEYVNLAQGTNYITFERTANDAGEVYLDYINTIGLQLDTNVVSNPGFETGNIDSWKEWHPDGQAPAYGVDTYDARSGSNKLYFWSELPYQQSVFKDMVIDNGTYEISAWVKLQSYSGQAPITAQMETFNGDEQKNIAIPLTSTWTQIKTKVNLETRDLHLGFHINAPGHTSLQIDDITIKPLLANGNFEYGHIQGWTEWHPEGQEAKFGVDKGSLNNFNTMPYNSLYKLYFWSESPYQQSVHQKLTGLENGTYKVNAYAKLKTYNNPSSPKTVARMEVSGHGQPQLDVTIPEAVPACPTCTNYEYAPITATFTVTTGELDLGFYVNALENYTSLQLDYVQLYQIQ